MSEGVYDTVNVTGEPEYEKPFGGTELHEYQYIELQQPEGVYDTTRGAEQTVFDGTLINPESHYMELKQLKDIYKTEKVEKQEVNCQQRCY